MSGREDSLCKGPVSEGAWCFGGSDRRPMWPEGTDQGSLA